MLTMLSAFHLIMWHISKCPNDLFCLGVKHLTFRHQEKNKNRSLGLQFEGGNTFLRHSQFFKRLLQQARVFYFLFLNCKVVNCNSPFCLLSLGKSMRFFYCHSPLWWGTLISFKKNNRPRQKIGWVHVYTSVQNITKKTALALKLSCALS